MGDELATRFGRRPRGAWLAERVWEPSLPADLVRGGYAWTILDDNHLRAASVAEDAMWSAFTTDDQGERLTVFGTEQGLRYRIPFGQVEDLIEYLREHATEDGRRVGMPTSVTVPPGRATSTASSTVAVRPMPRGHRRPTGSA